MIIGDSGVGKTSILRAYANKPFKSTHLGTTGVDHVIIKHTTADGRKVRVKFWDTAG